MHLFSRMQDDVPGIFTRVQRLLPGDSYYTLGDEVVIPVEDIQMAVPAPTLIQHMNPNTNTLCLMSAEVCPSVLICQLF